MPSIDASIVSLVMDPKVRRIFAQVVRNRKIRFGELLSLSSEADSESSDELRKQIKKTLHRLKAEQLIKDTGAAVEDFNTYYVTARGLEASREARI